MAARTLHVRCGTWEQVDVFLSRKLRKGRFLSMKVPFSAKARAEVTLGLEVPTGDVIAIDGIVQKTGATEGDPPRTWIELELVGLTTEVLARIRAMGKAAREEETTDPKIEPVAPVRKSGVHVAEELPGDERELFNHLSGELRRLRQVAVHEVLGVARDAEPDEVRAAWRNLVRRYHPDLVARRGAPAITHLAEELAILANRAYDRLRSALVAEGRATAAGPSVATPPGWLVGFEDIQSADSTPVPRPAVARANTPPPIREVSPAPASTGQGGEAFEQRARAMLADGDANAAREVLAAALVVYPRSKPLRSLYYVASALAAIQGGEVMLAQSQLETALAHHEQCIEASRLLEHLRKFGPNDHEAMRRLFA